MSWLRRRIETVGRALERPLPRFLLFVAVASVARAVLRGVPVVDVDEASYLAGSWELLRGHRLYTDFADHKPPLVWVYYALAQLLLGRGMHSVRLLTDLVTVPLTAFALSAFFRHGRRGLVAGLLYLVYGSAFLGHDVLAVNCELLMLLPLSWALVLVGERRLAARPGRALAAGLLVGVAVLFKYQAAVWLPPVAVAAGSAAPRRRAWRGVAVVVAAGVPLLLAWATFAALGSGSDFLYWNLAHNLGYVEHTVSLADAGERALAYLLPFLLATAPLAWMAVRATVGPEAPTAADREAADPTAADARYRALLLAATAGLALAAGFLGGRFYPHYFVPLYVPLALLAAPAVAAALRPPLAPRGRRFLAATAVLWAGFTAANAYLYLARDDVYVETRPVFDAVAQRLRADPCFGEGPLFVWGFAPSFYAETGLPVASRFVFVQPTLTGRVTVRSTSEDLSGVIRPEHWEWLMSDLERNRPTYVLDTSRARLSRWDAALEAYPRLSAFVGSSYAPLAVVDAVRVYRRRGCRAVGESRR